jgi:hypothetical protein
VDHGLILDKNKGLSANWRGFLDSDLFLKGKSAWTRSRAHGPRRRRSMVDQGQGLSGGLPELSLVATSVHGGSPREGENRAGDAMQPGSYSLELGRQRNSGGASAQNGGGASMIEDGKRRVGGVGCSTGVWASFYRARWEVEVARIGGR